MEKVGFGMTFAGHLRLLSAPDIWHSIQGPKLNNTQVLDCRDSEGGSKNAIESGGLPFATGI